MALAEASNERAIRNARTAATQCSRRRVERAEVEAFLNSVAVTAVASRTSTSVGATVAH